MLYLFFKFLHIVAVISWMAGLLYVFRLFIYHLANIEDDKIHSLFQTMERRLLNFITIPAMIVAWVAAISMLVIQPEIFVQKWLHYKIMLVLGITYFSVFAIFIRLKLQKKTIGSITDFKLRVYNEIPTLLLLGVVYFVVFRPF